MCINALIQAGIKARPLWKLLNKTVYKDCFSLDTPNAEWLYDRIICLPSGVNR
jgi:dTDP-4-amino-4,6-dideoxygalactose transaminase